ncbi:DUF937 domain-containing protein [Flavobacterium sp. NRK F10]|uniref:DUF937 domain-containing protein n=1 Tax=Flavobacterium sp. NRK F10 TaxID=2954931 RepID=UPI0020907133|nr:DUF937 domain-containing protein [Flavobacterium sp. NRK F10]MCO6175706.1 DUF937 domain-containing protein [Flavobacterium sp. NRK F10]
MAGILDLINSDLGKQIIGNISAQTGISETQASDVVSSSVPELLGAMQGNMLSGDSANGLLNALTSGKHNGSILDNVSGFLNGGDFSDGSKILNHLLGDKLNAVSTGISNKTGVSSSIITKILPMLAPIIMGYLGKQTQKGNVSSTSDLGGLLGGLLTGVTSGNSGSGDILTSVLDQNGDGKLDASDAISAVTKKKGGLGGLLGGLFGK